MPSSSSTQCSPAGIRAKRSGTNGNKVSRAMQGEGMRYWRPLTVHYIKKWSGKTGEISFLLRQGHG